MTFFERYKLTSRLSMSRREDIWVGSVNLWSMLLAAVERELKRESHILNQNDQAFAYPIHHL